MEPFSYHEGQRIVQREANSVRCADKLATWVGPVVEFATIADLIVMASLAEDGFQVAALSGPAPLVAAREEGADIVIGFPNALGLRLPVGRRAGGIVINPAQARRSRISGVLVQQGEELVIRCQVGFTNCRKYMAPTASTGSAVHIGPTERRPLRLDDPWAIAAVAAAETAFLVTATPGAVADVSHRGGHPGFLRYVPTPGTIEWTEYLGDGMFVSTGNLRIDGRFALLILEFETGDALRLDGEATYTNIRADRHERVDALIQAGEPFPVQGRMTANVRRAERLLHFTEPRTRIPRKARITSADTTEVQHPQ